MNPVIITVFDSELRTTKEYPFAKSPIRIGRNPLNDLALPFPFVSGWHAVVRFDENTPRFYDLGSTNGTLHEGRRIQAGEPLDVGTLLSVTIGRLELRLSRGDADVAGVSEASAPAHPPVGPAPVMPTQAGQVYVPPATANLSAPAGAPMIDPTAAVPAMPPLMPSAPAIPSHAPAPVSHPPPTPHPHAAAHPSSTSHPAAVSQPPSAANPPSAAHPAAPHLTSSHGQPAPAGVQRVTVRPGHAPAPQAPAPHVPQAHAPPAVAPARAQHQSGVSFPAAQSQPPQAAPQAVGGGAEGTAHLQMGAVHDAIQRARPNYDAMQRSATQLVADLSAAMQAMPPPLQQLTIPMVAREFPEVTSLPQFIELAAKVGAPLPNKSGGGGGGGIGSLQTLSSRVRPDESPPNTAAEGERFLACVGDVLLAAAGAMIELQKGQEQFGSEMGVRVIKEYTPLHAAGTPENLLRYLLDWNKGGPHRTAELRGMYADLMIHQVALIRGVVEGARSLIAHLDPREIERGLTSTWPSKSAAAWKAYERMWQDMSGSDQRITELIFGPDFARAYAEVGGEG